MPIDVIRDERKVLVRADLFRIEPVSVGQDDNLGAGRPQSLDQRRKAGVERHLPNDAAKFLLVAVRDEVPLPLKALAASYGTADVLVLDGAP